MTNHPPGAGSFDSPCGLAQDDSAVERSDLGIAPYAGGDALLQPSCGRSTATDLSQRERRRAAEGDSSYDETGERSYLKFRTPNPP